jgi:hypothetical protein
VVVGTLLFGVMASVLKLSRTHWVYPGTEVHTDPYAAGFSGVFVLRTKPNVIRLLVLIEPGNREENCVDLLLGEAIVAPQFLLVA